MLRNSFFITKHMFLMVPLAVLLTFSPGHRNNRMSKTLASAETSICSDLEALDTTERYSLIETLENDGSKNRGK